MAKPSLSAIWTAFPDHGAYPTLKDLYTMLGGVAAQNIDAPGFGPNGNTCASRLSVAFNGGGSPINRAIANNVGAATIGTASRARIIYRVRDFRNYLIGVLGRPTIDSASPFDDDFKTKKGIIAFTVEGWTDASGHIALVSGGAYREPAHDNYAAFIRGQARTVRGEFWELG